MAPRDVPQPPGPTPRRFLFLQGPISPFFAELGLALAERGHAVHRINLSLGDRLFWSRARPRLPDTDYTGAEAEWPRFVADFLDRHAITDLLLLGEQRDYHRAAIQAARARDIAVTVTDFGYFRPDWITLEPDGMGGDSRFPRDARAIHALAADAPPADIEPRLRDDFPRQARWDVLYHLANLLPWPFPHYRTHHLHHPIWTYAGIGRRLLRRGAEFAEGARALAACAGKPYWVFAMQMETDFSIRAYSHYLNMDAPLADAIYSFARHAPPEGQMIVKVHPLDPCLKRWGRRIKAIAAGARVEDRIHVAHHGVLDLMLDEAQGLVTVNSTVGLRAIVIGRPVKALGRAVWDIPGLSHQGPLDTFWTEAAPPEPQLRADFLAALQATTQVRGVFYADAGRAEAVRGAVARLEEGQRVGAAQGLRP